jgi:hypothetical protein
MISALPSTFRAPLMLGVLVTLCLACGSGCAAMGRWCDGLLVHVHQAHDLAAIRKQTRDELSAQLIEEKRLAAEREVQLAHVEAQRLRMEAEFCQAQQLALQEHLRGHIRETLESKVAFNVVQGLEVGELEVDVEKLKEVIALRERQPVTAPPRLPIKQPCECCDRPCGCQPGLFRRHCPRCKHQPCMAEVDCGGPAALRELQQLPLQQALRPAEIPLKLPVYLSFGMQQPLVEQARVRRQPILPQREFLRQPCPYPGPCDDPLRPRPHPYPCDAPAHPAGVVGQVPFGGPGAAAGAPPMQNPNQPVDSRPTFPVPSPDEARRSDPPPPPAVRVSLAPSAM